MSLTQINKAGLDEIALDHVFTIGASGSSAYTFQGEGLNGTVNNPTLYLTRGKTYRFENGSGGHPIRIQSTSGASGTAYNTGVTNNAGSGTVIVEVQHDAPDVLYYQCTSHAAMNGILYITGALADGGVTTAKLADDAVTNDKLANSVVASIAANTAKTSNATHTGDLTGSTSLTIADNAVTSAKISSGGVQASNMSSNSVTTGAISTGAVTTAKIADDAVTTAKVADSAVTGAQIASGAVSLNKLASDSVGTAKIIDQAVTLAKLPHGTSSNNGKFLRANNGADPTFEDVPAGGISNLVEDTSPQLGGDLDTNGHEISLDDAHKIKFGNSNDLLIEHDGGNSYIQDVGTGDLIISSSRVRLKSADTTEDMIKATGNGGVEIFHNNIEMIETFDTGDVGDSASNTGSGVKTTGNTGGGTRSNHGYYIYQGSNLCGMLANHGSGPEGKLILHNQGVPKISMNGTNGTLTLHGSAGYIQFGDTGSASHRLDDYEEGEFIATNAHGGVWYSNENTLSYVKVGNVCHIHGQVRAYSGSGNVRISLPFSSANGTEGAHAAAGALATYDWNAAETTDADTRVVIIDEGVSYMRFVEVIDNGNWSELQWDSNAYIRVGFTYRTT